jgi:probable rRNA maturation factor
MASSKDSKIKKNLRKWQIDITTESHTARINKRPAKIVIQQILNELDLSHINQSVASVSVLFTDNKEIQLLNSEYRGKDKPTDVLSFSHIEGEDSGQPATILGDLIISLETAKRQAPKFGNTFPKEIARLLVHGILHLAGYDHENVSAKEAQRMRRTERKIFTLLPAHLIRQILKVSN